MPDKKNGGTDEEITSGDNLPYYFLLPRVGKTIKVACNECGGSEETGFTLLEVDWNGERFTVGK